MVPDFCAKTKKQEVQPYMGIYVKLLDILDKFGDREDDLGAWIALADATKGIGFYAYQEVENPVYDRDACQKWKEERMKDW